MKSFFRRTSRMFPMLFSGLALSASLQAQGPLDQPISIDLKQADARTVLSSFHRITGFVGEVDPEIHGEVTISIRQVSWPTALDAICEGLGCSWTLESGHPKALNIFADPAAKAARDSGATLGDAIDLALKDAAASETLKTLARILDSELKIEEGTELEGSVSLVLDGVSVRTALDAICEGLGCKWSLAEDVLLVVAAVGDGSARLAGPEEVMEVLQEPFSMALRAAPAGQTLRAFGSILGVGTRVDSEVAKRGVTIELEEASVQEALNRTCALIDCRWSLVPEGEGLILEVLPDS